MSLDVRIVDKDTRELIELEQTHTLRGGTYEVGGTKEAWLNVTTNYSPHLFAIWDRGLKHLHGRSTKEAKPILKRAITIFGDY